MPSLSDHKDDIARMYFGEGRSYQEIGDHFGKTREAVRQFLNRHFPGRVGGRTFRQELRNAERKRIEEKDLEIRRAIAPPCIICYKPVTRKTGGRGTNRTCCSEHSELWSKARFLLNPELRDRQRLSMARSIIKYQDFRPSSAVSWANKVVKGESINTRTYAYRDSEARRAYEKVLQIREGKK